MNYSRYYERIMKKLYSQVKKLNERIHVTHNNQKWFGKAGNPVFVSLSPFHPKLPFPNSVLFHYPLSIISLPFPLNCISHPPISSLLFLHLLSIISLLLPSKLYLPTTHPLTSLSPLTPSLSLSLQFPLPSYPFLSLNFQDFIHLVILLTVCYTILMTFVLRIRYKIN